jgi:hypothetical protein
MLALAAGVLTPCSGLAQSAPPPQFGRIALVDVSTIFLLHPYMTDYIVEESSFLRPLPPGTDPATRPVILKHRVEEAEKLARASAQTRSRLEAEIKTLQLEELNLTSTLNAGMDKLLKDLRVDLARTPAKRRELEQAFAKAQTELEQKAWTRKKTINDIVTTNLHAIQEKLAEPKNTAFLSDGERDARFKEMADQINQAIDSVTAGRFSVVVNRGYLHGPPQSPLSGDAPTRPFFPRPIESYINQYHDFWTRVEKKDEPQSMYLIENQLTMWLDIRSRLPQTIPAVNDLFGFIIRGGEDITAPVLEKILAGTKLPDERVAVLFKYLKSH